MRSPHHRPSRREFVRFAGLAAGAAGLVAPPRSARAADPGPDAVLARLLEGNKRFMAGQTSLLTRRRPEDFAALAEGQAPSAIIVACADSRVAPELIFDQGIADLFVWAVVGALGISTGSSAARTGTVTGTFGLSLSRSSIVVSLPSMSENFCRRVCRISDMESTVAEVVDIFLLTN